MADYTAKLAGVAAGVLEPGEELLAGVRAMSKGATGAIIADVAGAVSTGAVGGRAGEDEMAEGKSQALAAGIGHAPQVSVGLTPRRLVVWKRSPLSGKAKNVLGQIAVQDVESIEGSDSGSKLKPDILTVRMKDGSQIDFEVVKADDYEAVVREFRGLRAS